ncbi:MAG TPA: LLM class F420-dependent oxidoreductase [Microthrixaceae bacterium]|nr:LLM class F420-dependent oxidoreductase [Microthrixaceae bacterium]
MSLSPIGIWTAALDLVSAHRAQEIVSELDEQGWGALWIPEILGRDALIFAGVLLAGSPTITVATGIANVWGRDPMAMRAGQLTLAETYPDRFILGLGVSHEPLIKGVRNHDYRRPLDHMREYLDAMDAAPFMAPTPATPPPRVLAALGPRMLDLAAERADGVHTYLVTPDHTAIARAAVGSDAIVAVEQKVVLATDPTQARDLARTTLAMYLELPNYANSLHRLGFADTDLASGGSDRLVDALVAWGDIEAVAGRIQGHLDAGATHVCIQVLGDAQAEPPTPQWAELAHRLTTK